MKHIKTKNTKKSLKKLFFKSVVITVSWKDVFYREQFYWLENSISSKRKTFFFRDYPHAGWRISVLWRDFCFCDRT